MIKSTSFFILLLLFIPTTVLFAQELPSEKPEGMFSLGVRSTISLFSDAKATGIGSGGQFRIRLSRKINTDWFADYMTTDLNGLGKRVDAHIGWSVMFYPFENIRKVKSFTPYIVAGHCFDYTAVSPNHSFISFTRWSSAVQTGIGTHFNFNKAVDFSLTTQYMMHLGGHIDSEIKEENGFRFLDVQKKEEFSLEGHLLITLSANIEIGHLW